jgi:tRNA-Thr(GGU) m(6)t(6)A37 methyltransferase TsaA
MPREHPDLAPWHPPVGMTPRLSDAERVTLATKQAMQIDQDSAHRSQWQRTTDLRPPIGFVTCKAVYSKEQVGRLLRAVQAELATVLGIEGTDIYLTVRRANEGELLVRDQIWNGDNDAQPVISRPVAHVVGGRGEVFDDAWDGVESVIRLDSSQFTEEALYGLETFSHLEVVFHFDRVPVEKIETGARHPRGNKDWPLIGIFAQRGKNRPNRLGVSRCRLHRVDGLDLHVSGLDAVDGSPVLDIKPYMAEFGPRGETSQPVWATEIMRDYY